MRQLDGRVALVTGAARGQGRAHAVALAREGATVVVTDICAQLASVPYPMGTREDLEETVELVSAAGGRAEAAVLDVRDGAAVTAVVADVVGRHGRLDVLAANAGISTQSPVQDISDERWTEMIDTNLSGVFHCLRAVLPPMRAARWGRIVVTSSGAGRAGMRNLGHYAASKWGVIGLTKTLALEVAAEGITANVLCPTTVDTPMVRTPSTYRLFMPDVAEPTEEQAVERFARMSPMKVPWVPAEEMSRALMYLVLDPGYTTGTVLEVNLGTSANRT